MNFLLFVPAIFISWVVATYLLEGRLGEAASLDQQSRIVYIIVANVAIGTIFASFVLRGLLKRGLLQIHHTGYENFRNSRIKISVSVIVGVIIFVFLGKHGGPDPLVFANLFFHVISVTIAEVIVCWALIGNSIRLFPFRQKTIQIISLILISSIVFGIYHFAHSPPYSDPTMVGFLTGIGLVTGIAYFVFKNIYSAILIQNFLGMTGISQNVNLVNFSQPLCWVYGLTMVSILALVISYYLVHGSTSSNN